MRIAKRIIDVYKKTSMHAVSLTREKAFEFIGFYGT